MLNICVISRRGASDEKESKSRRNEIERQRNVRTESLQTFGLFMCKCKGPEYFFLRVRHESGVTYFDCHVNFNLGLDCFFRGSLDFNWHSTGNIQIKGNCKNVQSLSRYFYCCTIGKAKVGIVGKSQIQSYNSGNLIIFDLFQATWSI